MGGRESKAIFWGFPLFARYLNLLLNITAIGDDAATCTAVGAGPNYVGPAQEANFDCPFLVKFINNNC